MTTRLRSAAVFGAALLCTPAFAGVSVTSSQLLWNGRVNNAGLSVASENFNSYSGFYASMSGNLGGIDWSAQSSGGLVANGSYVHTGLAESTLTFTFSPGVRGVAGNIFGTDVDFNVVETIVSATLSDGTTYDGITNSAANFIGFFSSAATISSLSVTVISPGSTPVYATLNNLFVAVPAPSAAALVGLAGLVTRRRR